MNNTAFKEALKKADNMEEFLKICSDYYDMKNAKLGVISKGMLINNIDLVIKLSGAKPKK